MHFFKHLGNQILLKVKHGHFCDMEVGNLKFDIIYFLYCR